VLSFLTTCDEQGSGSPPGLRPWLMTVALRQLMQRYAYRSDEKGRMESDRGLFVLRTGNFKFRYPKRPRAMEHLNQEILESESRNMRGIGKRAPWKSILDFSIA
jgi:hypothetical protein